MTFGPYSFSIPALAIALVALVWLVAVLLAAMLPGTKKKGYSLRRVDVFALVLSIAFGTTWFFAFLHKGRPEPAASAPVRSCVLIEPGQTEAKVRQLVGEPNEIHSAVELRGPGSDLWVYRNERCVVHFLDGAVISVE